MLIVLSPAKTLNFETDAGIDFHTLPDFIDRSDELAAALKQLAPAQIASLMGISDQLARLNAERFASWSREFAAANAKQAILAFNGDVYEGLDAVSLTRRQLDYAQAHIRILSGLYGVLRPLDLMQPYRLEMGTRFANARGKDLYAFWGNAITETLDELLSTESHKALINLASEEYFRVVKPALLSRPVITPVFEDWKGGKYKVISFHAKRARGMMARFAAVKKIKDPEKLKAFDAEGYAFDKHVSSGSTWVFRRKIEP